MGTTATLTATVGSSIGSPAGKVNFNVGGETIGSCTLSGGSCSISEDTANLTAATYPVTATYVGVTGFGGSTSGRVDVTLVKASSTTTLNVATNPVTVPASDALTATVATPGGAATGKVTFSVNGYVLGTAALSNGTATLTASSQGITGGTYPITATYGGNAYSNGSTSSVVQVVVNP